jgi:winged helix-turn helix protein
MTVIAMSGQELDRMQVLQDLCAKRITASEAAGLMRLTRRQVFRLARRYREDGPVALVSRRRGHLSNRHHPACVRAEALALIKAHYADFGPTLAAEKLAERHNLRLGVETLRQWMLADGIWKDRKQRLPRIYQPRYRRTCLGELIQIDGCEHWWFESRGPQCTLLAFVDDATSRIMHAVFVPTESTFAYFRAARAYLARYGKPVAFYSDKHAVFRVNGKEAKGGDGMTQFGRALDELTIEIICANAPQSKGRVERCFGTLQDRLVKELRLSGIDTLEAGNVFLSGFLEAHNARFAKSPVSDRNAHRPLTERDDLDEVFAWKEERTVTRSLTLQYDQTLFLLEPTEVTRPLARQRVTVCDYPDGRLAIKHKGRELPYRVFDKRPRVNQAAVVENKRLGPVLAYIAERQKDLDMSRSRKAPSRRGQAAGLFKVG